MPFSAVEGKLFVRIFVYLLVVGGNSTVLYSIVTSQKRITPEADFDGSSCLLFGSWYTPTGSHAHGKTVAGGATQWCKFVEFASAAQLALAVIMALINGIRLIKLTRRDSHRNIGRPSFSAVIELCFVTPAFIAAVISACIVSSGLAIFCSRLLDNWNGSAYYNQGMPAPSSCSSAMIPVRDGQYKFYKTLDIAQITMWIPYPWLVHVVLSFIATREWMDRSWIDTVAVRLISNKKLPEEK